MRSLRRTQMHQVNSAVTERYKLTIVTRWR
jgi:hypothetical protein